VAERPPLPAASGTGFDNQRQYGMMGG